LNPTVQDQPGQHSKNSLKNKKLKTISDLKGMNVRTLFRKTFKINPCYTHVSFSVLHEAKSCAEKNRNHTSPLDDRLVTIGLYEKAP
jgi:hypothetical protein